MPSIPVNPSPTPAIPTRQQMVDGAVVGIFASVMNSDGSMSVRLVQSTDDGKLMVGGDATALLETQRTAVLDALIAIVSELRMQNIILAQAHGIPDDLDRLRQDVEQSLHQS